PAPPELVCARGRGDARRGVPFECDYPQEARDLPVVSSSGLEATADAPDAIDAAVREATAGGEPLYRLARAPAAAVRAAPAGGEPLYRLDDAAIAAIDPDVILTQDLCRVCAVPSGDVDAALDRLGCRGRGVSLAPPGPGAGRGGGGAGAGRGAAAVLPGLGRRLAAVETAVGSRDRPRVLVLEWVDPP